MRPPQRQTRTEMQYGFDQQDLGSVDLGAPELVMSVAFQARWYIRHCMDGSEFYPSAPCAAKALIARNGVSMDID